MRERILKALGVPRRNISSSGSPPSFIDRRHDLEGKTFVETGTSKRRLLSLFFDEDKYAVLYFDRSSDFLPGTPIRLKIVSDTTTDDGYRRVEALFGQLYEGTPSTFHAAIDLTFGPLRDSARKGSIIVRHGQQNLEAWLSSSYWLIEEDKEHKNLAPLQNLSTSITMHDETFSIFHSCIGKPPVDKNEYKLYVQSLLGLQSAAEGYTSYDVRAHLDGIEAAPPPIFLYELFESSIKQTEHFNRVKDTKFAIWKGQKTFFCENPHNIRMKGIVGYVARAGGPAATDIIYIRFSNVPAGGAEDYFKPLRHTPPADYILHQLQSYNATTRAHELINEYFLRLAFPRDKGTHEAAAALVARLGVSGGDPKVNILLTTALEVSYGVAVRGGGKTIFW